MISNNTFIEKKEFNSLYYPYQINLSNNNKQENDLSNFQNLNGKSFENYYFSNFNTGNNYEYKNIYNHNNVYPKQFYKKPYFQNEEENIIESLKYVQENYPRLINLNINNIGYTDRVKLEVEPKFYVIKSFTEEDIHKSIKYKCWSSTRDGNKKLNWAFEKTNLNNSNVYLFFSMNGSGRFVGVARMASKCDQEMIFEYWAMDEIWKGLMQVEWIFIKDVPNKILKEIKLINNYNKPVTNSRDTQEIPREEGEIMMNIFENYRYQTSILQHFQYYDQRQDLFEKSRNKSNH